MDLVMIEQLIVGTIQKTLQFKQKIQEQNDTKMYNFDDVQKLLFEQEKIVVYKSLTSDKEHTTLVTVPRKFQKDSDKIVVLDVEKESWHDIQIDTILSISVV